MQESAYVTPWIFLAAAMKWNAPLDYFSCYIDILLKWIVSNIYVYIDVYLVVVYMVCHGALVDYYCS
jgi:hypothetical protein